MPAWLQQEWCLSFVLTLGHFLWQGTLIAIVLAIALRATKTTQVRYWLSLAALLVMAGCPILTLGWLMQPVSAVAVPDPPPLVGQEPALNDPQIVITPVEESPEVAIELSLSEPPADAQPEISVAETIPQQPPVDNRTWWQKFAPQLTAIYLSGVTLMLLRLAIGLWGGRRLRRRVTLIDNPSLLDAMHRQAAALGLKLLPVLAYCERVTVPTVVGVLKPMILLPISLSSGLSLEQIESVLAHELAHLRRFDHLINLLQRVIESLLFFHPAVWWVSRRIRIEREHCCDDLVVACGAVPLDYATSLLVVAQLSRAAEQQRPQRSFFAAVSLLATDGKPSTLRQRIARLLGEPTTPSLRISPRVLLVMICIPFIAMLVTVQSGVSNHQSTLSLNATDEEIAEEAAWDELDAMNISFYGEAFEQRSLMRRVRELEKANFPEKGLQEIRQQLQLPIRDAEFWSLPADAWPHVGRMVSLRQLNIVGSDLRGKPMEEIGRLSQLRKFKATNSQLQPQDLASLRRLTEMEHLEVMFTVFEETAAWRQEQLGELSEAERELANRVEAMHPNGEHLWQAAILTDRALEELRDLKQLQTVKLINTFVSLRGVRLLSTLPKLEELELGVADESPEVIQLVAGMSSMKRLSGLSLTDATLAELTALTQLEELAGNAGGVTDDSVEQITKFSQLRRLVLWHSQLTDDGLLRLAQLPNLESLDVRFSESLTQAGVERFQQQNSKCKIMVEQPGANTAQANTDREVNKASANSQRMMFVEPLTLKLTREQAHEGRWFFVDLDRGTLSKPPFVVELDRTKFPFVVLKPDEAALKKWLIESGTDLVLFVEPQPLAGKSGQWIERITSWSIRTSRDSVNGLLAVPHVEGQPWRWNDRPELVLAPFARKDEAIHVSGFVPNASGHADLYPGSPDLQAFRTANNVVGFTLLEHNDLTSDSVDLRIVHVANATVPLADHDFDGLLVSGRLGAADQPSAVKPIKAELPDGRSVEFVGITKNTAPANAGWKPDGTPIGDVGYWPSTTVLHDKNTSSSFVENGPHPEPDSEAVDLLFRFRGLKEQPSLTFEMAANGANRLRLPLKEPYELRVSTRRRGDPPAGGRWSIPDGEFRVGLTDEPWGKWLQVSPEGKVLNRLTEDDLYQSSYEQVRIERVEPHERAPNKQALILRQPTNASSLYVFEIRGIDEEGKSQWVLQWEGHGVQGTDLEEGHWGLASTEKQLLARYEFRLRPYRHWVTFQNVSLEPGQQTEVNTIVESVPDKQVRADRGASDPALVQTERLQNSSDEANRVDNTNVDTQVPTAVTSKNAADASTSAAFPDQSASLRVQYEMPGAEAETRIYLQRPDPEFQAKHGRRDEYGREGDGGVRFSRLKNGESLTLSDLRAGTYQVARYRLVEIVRSGTSSAQKSVFLDRQWIEIADRETKSIRMSRPAGQPISGRVVIPNDFEVNSLVVHVCNEKAGGCGTLTHRDVVQFDALNANEDGTFKTEPLPPGRYKLVVEGYANHSLALSGEIAPSWEGTADVTVTGSSAPSAIEVTLRELDRDAWLKDEIAAEKSYADVGVAPNLPVGLEFLKPYPNLHGLSLDMTEPQFLEIVEQQELETRRTAEGENITHHIGLGDGHTLIIMFDKDAKCSGIQRIRGEEKQKPAEEEKPAEVVSLVQLDPPPVVGNFSQVDDPDVLLDQLAKSQLPSLVPQTGGGFFHQPGAPPQAMFIPIWEHQYASDDKLDPRILRLIELGDRAVPRVHQRLNRLTASDVLATHLSLVLRSVGGTESVPVLIKLMQTAPTAAMDGTQSLEDFQKSYHASVTQLAATSALWKLTGRRHLFTPEQWEKWWVSVKPDFVVLHERQSPEFVSRVTPERINALANELATNEVSARERLILLGPAALPHLLTLLEAELPKPPLNAATQDAAEVSPRTVRLAWVIDELGATDKLPAKLRRDYFTQRFAKEGTNVAVSPILEQTLCRAVNHCSFADFCHICLKADGHRPDQDGLRLRGWMHLNPLVFSRRFDNKKPFVVGDLAFSGFRNDIIPAADPAAEIAGAVPVIVAGLSDNEPQVRYCAAKLADLVGLCSQEKPEPLIEALRDHWLTESDANIRLDIGIAMTRFQTPLVLEAISKGLRSDRLEIVNDAVGLMRDLPLTLNDATKPDFDLLVQFTQHENDQLRRRAVSSLRSQAPSLLAPEFDRLVTDKVEDIRKECAYALRNRPDPRFADVLFNLADDPNEQVRIEALSSIGNLNHPASMERLLPHLRDSKVHGYAVAALASMGGQEALPFMFSELEAGNDVGGMVYQHLRRLTGESFEEKPEPWLAWWKQQKPAPKPENDAAATSPRKDLEFLQPYPKLHGLSLDMTEPQFLEVVKQQELQTRKTVEGEKVTHHIGLGDGHTLIVMFNKDANCSGILKWTPVFGPLGANA